MKLLCTGLIAVVVLASAPAWADEVVKPVKVTAAAAGGPIFSSPSATRIDHGGVMTNVVMGNSGDKKFSAGLFKAGQSDWPIDSYPQDEFCYFLSGSVKLTSADGSVIDLKAGEAVFIPKGWKGRWTTSGYSKYYVVYDSK